MTLKSIQERRNRIQTERDRQLEILKSCQETMDGMVYQILRDQIYKIYQPEIDKTIDQFDAVQAFMLQSKELTP